MNDRIPEPWLPDDDITPPTEPKGELLPPPRLPPTAVSAAAAGPEPRPPRPARSWSPPARARRRSPFLRALRRTLDVLDGVADGLRSFGKSLAASMGPRRRPD